MDLFDEFKQAFKREGFADPRPFLDRAAADERDLVSALIDAYLEEMPVRVSDVSAYEKSVASQLARALDHLEDETTGHWARVLPLLRKRARLRRRDVVAQLTKELGLEGGEDLVKEAFHDMESGFLGSDDVQPPVLDALAKILGETADALRTWGRRPGSSDRVMPTATAFARDGGDPSYSRGSSERERPANDPSRQQLERRVAELFRAGGAQE
jgi:hypothetical protein